MKKFVLCSSLLAAMISTASAAENNIATIGTLTVTVPLHRTENALANSTIEQPAAAVKRIILNKIRLSPAAQHYLVQTLATASHSPPPVSTLAATRSTLPTRVELGMNQVPVLDQGEHGSCVTFSNTAALDAGYKHGDYISQLCNLELGEYLHQKDNSYISGWNGSSSALVLNQIQNYGIISNDYQRNSGCAGVYAYPLDDENNIGNPMSSADFKRHSENIMQTITATSLLSYDEALSSPKTSAQLLNAVKTAIAGGHRVTLGILIDPTDGDVGAYGNYKTAGDSWMITPKIAHDAKRNAIDAGHAIVITGYDDNAVIIGPKNLKEKGAFKLRNSWSSAAGDHGDYYMSYNYFAALAMEAYKITAPTDVPVTR